MEKVDAIRKILHKTYPNPTYYLKYGNNVQLVVAAILSPQVRDEVVNTATAELFKKKKTAADFAAMTQDELLEYVRRVSFAGNKTKYILGAMKELVAKHNGKVPQTVSELTALPGIGKKTANAILANAYDIISGVAVDTHVIRVAFRLGWTSAKSPAKIEKDLMAILPKKEWKTMPWILKDHGRAICKAPTPTCSVCPLEKLCLKQGVEKKAS